jgi:hypothetical protein
MAVENNVNIVQMKRRKKKHIGYPWEWVHSFHHLSNCSIFELLRIAVPASSSGCKIIMENACMARAWACTNMRKTRIDPQSLFDAQD